LGPGSWVTTGTLKNGWTSALVSWTSALVSWTQGSIAPGALPPGVLSATVLGPVLSPAGLGEVWAAPPDAVEQAAPRRATANSAGMSASRQLRFEG
jgi:hypothetical protein